MMQSPFFNPGDFEKATEKIRAIEKLAAKALIECGEKYLATHGEVKLLENIESVKIEIKTWNQVSGSTLIYGLSTIDTMLQVFATFPYATQNMQLALSVPFQDRYGMLAAIRNHIKKEIAKRVADANPSLSPESDGGSPKAS